ncbi:Phosphoglycolate phosphatase [Acidilobus saccharovorans 345-15]|uniref:Phosphoglycolate phosphatase n=1 Tax=Acidilobus saccharovorans (strain DSM 16705 / JCM 18335 / VKM B-2471 / 345-15) TaxID=666510 RepID=D9Q0W4_ACIS3|nr:phosphoglycolate phosphatase [Acidilobus saccharovorans]ADL18952.1 Phosphoglycolate phosphatase [Acidilobus saccharovorans 345-15]
MPLKAVGSDVDGTLTVRRGDLRVSVHAIRGIRLLESRGVKVILVSGNSLPVTAGLSVYLGSSGPVVAENGCVIMYRGQIYHVCSGRPPEGLLRKLQDLGLRPSWQNEFRYHDMAFFMPRGVDENSKAELLRAVSEIAEAHGLRVLWSGYAVHINPGNGKGEGLLRALELIGVSASEAAAIGDGENDLDMLSVVPISGCPGDAAPAVKVKVKFVARGRGGAGFLEFARWLLAKGERN